MKIFETSRFWSQFSKMSILVKISKISILDKIFEKDRFRSKFAKISNLGIIFEKPRFYSKHLDFGPKFRKSWFWSKCLKNHDRSKNYLDFGQTLEKQRFGSKSVKISMLVKICEIPRFWLRFSKIAILENFSKNNDLWNFQVWSKASKYLDFIRAISILFPIPEISIWLKFSKKLTSSQIFEITRFWSKF